MPVAQTVPTVSSPPSNCYGLVTYLAQRVPGFDFSEYLREINAAYIHVWEEITKIQNMYFTNIVQVQVAVDGQRNLDLLYNADGNLSAAVSPRLYQVMRIRTQPPSGGLFQACSILHFNDPDFVSIEANPLSQSTQTGPYYYIVYGHGRLRSAIPLAKGTTIEVTYTYWPIMLTYLQGGTISSAGTAVTGTGTNFTQLVLPDFQSTLPSAANVVNEEFIQAELIVGDTAGEPVGSRGGIYRITSITSDTALTTLNAISPAAVGGTAYVLATLPEIPREHIRVIGSIAMAKMYSVAGDDQRTQEWTAISTANVQLMKDALIERQMNNPPKKQRFQYGLGRRNRAFLR